MVHAQLLYCVCRTWRADSVYTDMGSWCTLIDTCTTNQRQLAMARSASCKFSSSTQYSKQLDKVLYNRVQWNYFEKFWSYLCFVHEKLKHWVVYQNSIVLAMVYSSQREQAITIIVSSIISLLICYYESDFGGLGACTAPWTNQMGYIIVIARVARDLWQCKPPLSLAYALGLRSVYCNKSLAPC